MMVMATKTRKKRMLVTLSIWNKVERAGRNSFGLVEESQKEEKVNERAGKGRDLCRKERGRDRTERKAKEKGGKL